VTDPDTSLLDRWPLVGRRLDLDTAMRSLTDPRSAGVVISGSPGVGKSRLADEVLAEAEALGRRVVRAIASESARAVPLGALSHLLPPEVLLEGASTDTLDPIRLIAHARIALAGEQGAHPVLAVDDVHLLDAVSATLLSQLAADSAASLILTARTDESLPDSISGLVRADRLTRIDLSPLPDQAVDTLLHLALGAPVEGRASASLRVASSGNPLVLRELVRAADASGVLVRRDGVWRLVGHLPPARGAAELLGARLESIDEAGRDVLELLALAGPVPLDLVLSASDIAVLERLEAADLIVLRPGTGPSDPDVIALAHPLVADSVRQHLSPLRSRSILAAHADRVEAVFGRTGEHALHLATWRLDAGLPVEPDLLETATLLAHVAGDLHLTDRLATAAEQLRPALSVAVLHGDALYNLGRWADAEAVLARATSLPGSPLERAALANTRSLNLLLGLTATDEAIAVVRAELDAVAPSTPDPASHPDVEAARHDLRCRLALLEVYAGLPRQALDTAGPRPELAPANASDRRRRLRGRVVWGLAASYALAAMGRSGEAAELARTTRVEHLELGHELGLQGPGIHQLVLAYATADRGDLHRAAELAVSGYHASIMGASLPGQVWFSLHLGRIAIIQGHPRTGERWLREALSVATEAGWRGPRALALSGLAWAQCLLGDTAGASIAVDDMDGIPETMGLLASERTIGPATLATVEGRVDEARQQWRQAAGDARSGGRSAVEAWMLHELARLGDAAQVADRLDVLAAETENPLVAARAAHVRALTSRDHGDLADAANGLATLGCDLVAAEAFSEASDLARTSGDQRRANGLATRAATLAAACEGAWSARLVSTATVVPLSAREREVANLAATGIPSKEIAERLFVSVRTVNNHLQNAYTKLGVSSRAELRAALDVGEGS
jgi:DNA-binding CsgD family transcriptional regulator